MRAAEMRGSQKAKRSMAPSPSPNSRARIARKVSAHWTGCSSLGGPLGIVLDVIG
jgi:hypothetical protein